MTTTTTPPAPRGSAPHGSTPRSRTNPNVAVRDFGSLMLDGPDLDRIPWCDSPRLPGLFSKTLLYNPDTGTAVSLTKVEKGAILPLHVHWGEAMVVVLKGRFSYEPTGSVGAGGFGYEAFGVVHEPDFPADEETIFYVFSTSHGILQFYNEDGSPGAISHIRDRLLYIRQRCGEAGVAHLNLPDWYWEG